MAKIPENKYTFNTLLPLVNEAQKLCNFDKINSRAFLNDLMLAVPLLYQDGKTLKFMHRSIAEYFAAEYTSNANNNKALLEKILASNSARRFSETIEYLFELSPNLYQEVIIKPISEDFIDEYKDENNQLYATMNFPKKWAISYWPYKEVVSEKNEDGFKNIDIPLPNFKPSTMSYMYGHINEEKFVACCCTQKNNRSIPDRAWEELTERFDGSKNIDFSRHDSDPNLNELNNNLTAKKWYYSNSEEIQEVKNTKSIQELLGRGNFRFTKNLSFDLKSTRVITLKNCRKILKSVKRIKEAESSIDELFNL